MLTSRRPSFVVGYSWHEQETGHAMIRLTNRTTGDVVDDLQIAIDRNGAHRLVDILTAAAGRDGLRDTNGCRSWGVPCDSLGEIAGRGRS